MNTITEVDENAATFRVNNNTSIISASISEPILHSECYRRELLHWVSIGLAYLFFFTILELAKVYSLSPAISLLPLFTLDLRIIVKSYLSNPSTPLYKFFLSRKIIHQLSSIAFKGMMVVYLLYPHIFSAVLMIIPIAITCIYDLVKRVPKENECKYLTWLVTDKQIFIISKWLFLLTMVNVGLKVEDIVNWNWSGVLWPVYIGLCFCTVILVGVMLFTLGSFLSWVSEEVSFRELISTFWLLVSLTGASVSILFLCVHVSNSSILTMDEYIYLLPISFLSFFVISTLLNMRNLVEWWTMFFSQGNAMDTEDLSISPSNPQANVSIPSRISQAVKKAPHALMRISSSYFLPAESPKKKISKRTFSLKTDNPEELKVDHRRIFSNPMKANNNEIISPTNAEVSDRPCHMCCEKSCNAVIMDCGHGGICYECSLEMWKTVGMCHMCRSPISQVLQIEIGCKRIVKVCSATRAVYYDDDDKGK